ncbi:MAG: aminoacyl-histidine dipeptidase [Candidatus Cryptobacteroides sp.]
MLTNRILDIFKVITTIPRESGHEEAMTAFLLDWAAEHNLKAHRDAIGNVCIEKEASAGKEDLPTLVLQSHQDMVCEKNEGVMHDFSKDPISYEIQDGWMIAKDTTLGADDGIGIAASLALLESELPCPKLECVFTIAEETGMDGAMAMEPGFFSGKTLINLDSEDEGQMFIGCAGGVTTEADYTYTSEEFAEGSSKLKLSIGNALGGHSGDDINKGRANTVMLMLRFLYGHLDNLQILKINGGGKHNAIARECTAVVASTEPQQIISAFRAFGEAVRKEFRCSDPDICFEAKQPQCQCNCQAKPIERQQARKIVSSLFACPHGVISMSQDIKDFVETSSNLASVKTDTENCCIHVCTSQRSSTSSECEMIAAKVEAALSLGGAQVRHLSSYPGWKPNVDSPVLKHCVESYERLFGCKPLVLAIHAGLECGLFLEKFPELDMISFGPTLRGVHAPGEKLDLASLDKFALHLEDVVVNFK